MTVNQNANNFKKEIYNIMGDDSRKTLVEVEKIGEIDRIEDIVGYLKLFLVKYPSALGP